MKTELANKLILMAEEDQRVLQQLFESGELPCKEYHPIMKDVHEKNNTKLKEIIAKNGWPGISLVGKRAAESAWLIVQHALSDPDFMSSSAELLKESVDRNDIEGWQLAFLQDRINTMAGK